MIRTGYRLCILIPEVFNVIDPDSNVTLDLADCRYFIEDQFNEFLQVQNIDKNRLSFMHINTRSLQCN